MDSPQDEQVLRAEVCVASSEREDPSWAWSLGNEGTVDRVGELDRPQPSRHVGPGKLAVVLRLGEAAVGA